MIQTIWSRQFDPDNLIQTIWSSYSGSRDQHGTISHFTGLTPCKMIWIFWLMVWFLAKLFEYFNLRFPENLIHAIWSRWFDPDNLIQTIWSRPFDLDNLIQKILIQKILFRKFDPDNFDPDNLIQTIADLAINMERFHISQVWLLAKWFEYFDLWCDSLQNHLNISI